MYSIIILIVFDYQILEYLNEIDETINNLDLRIEDLETLLSEDNEEEEEEEEEGFSEESVKIELVNSP